MRRIEHFVKHLQIDNLLRQQSQGLAGSFALFLPHSVTIQSICLADTRPAIHWRENSIHHATVANGVQPDPNFSLLLNGLDEARVVGDLNLGRLPLAAYRT